MIWFSAEHLHNRTKIDFLSCLLKWCGSTLNRVYKTKFTFNRLEAISNGICWRKSNSIQSSRICNRKVEGGRKLFWTNEIIELGSRGSPKNSDRKMRSASQNPSHILEFRSFPKNFLLETRTLLIRELMWEVFRLMEQEGSRFIEEFTVSTDARAGKEDSLKELRCVNRLFSLLLHDSSASARVEWKSLHKSSSYRVSRQWIIVAEVAQQGRETFNASWAYQFMTSFLKTADCSQNSTSISRGGDNLAASGVDFVQENETSRRLSWNLKNESKFVKFQEGRLLVSLSCTKSTISLMKIQSFKEASTLGKYFWTKIFIAQVLLSSQLKLFRVQILEVPFLTQLRLVASLKHDTRVILVRSS